MKPDWNQSPDWANYLAMDEDGTWCWFEYEPYLNHFQWVQSQGRWCPCDKVENEDWKGSLQTRPERSE